MILKNRIFERKEPMREAKSFYIFCEGNSREPEYLLYFKEIGDAIKNAHNNYVENRGNIGLCSTEMYKLGEHIYPLIEKTIIDGLNKIEK